MDFSNVTIQDSMEGDGDLKSLIGPDRAQSNRNIPPIWNEVSHSSFILRTVLEKLKLEIVKSTDFGISMKNSTD